MPPNLKGAQDVQWMDPDLVQDQQNTQRIHHLEMQQWHTDKHNVTQILQLHIVTIN